MLKREDAQKIIEAATLKNPDELLAKRIAALPKDLAKKTLDYLMLDANGKELEFSDWEKRNKFSETTTKVFQGISQQDFEAVLEVWFPRFHQIVKVALLRPENQSNGFVNHQPRPFHQQIEASQQLLGTSKRYDQSLEWFAEYAAYEWSFQYRFTDLFITDINLGNPTIFNIMLATAKNEHPVAVMGHTVIESLLKANRSQGWEIIEKTLLAAQRQEGLRQSIFSEIENAHPEALRRMLKLILEHDLLRFSSSVQWAQGFLPVLPNEPTPKILENALKDLVARLENQDANRAVLKDLKGTPTLLELYLALYALAMQNLEEAQNLVLPWLKHQDAKYRFLALHGLTTLDTADNSDVLMLMSDADTMIALKASQIATLPYDTLKKNWLHFKL
jgi:hypothetical protein